MYSEHKHINTLTALLVAHGVRHAVICPGNRNAPITHNLYECPYIVCHSVTDERSAAFMALGLGEALCQPVVVCVTSGSALLATIPAAAEATYRHKGIIVISADRPSAWIDQLDGQTIPQNGALSPFAHKSVTLPEGDSPLDHWHCNRLINEALLTLKRLPHPTVHINVPIREPLFQFTTPSLPEERVVRYAQWNDATCQELTCERLILVIGQTGHIISRELIDTLSKHMVVLTEQLSADTLCLTEQMLCILQSKTDKGPFIPDKVIYIGGHTVSKRLREWLRSLPETTQHIVVSEDGTLHDVSQHTTLLVEGDTEAVLHSLTSLPRTNESVFSQHWQALSEYALERHNGFTPRYSSMRAVWLLENISKTPATYCYANSMAVRYGMLYADHYVCCNRGLNGIEGSLSTAVGMSLADKNRRVICVVGDLSAFYDQNALCQQEIGVNLRILLLNNGGGGIFHGFMALRESGARDSLVSASHSLTAEGLCLQCSIKYLRACDDASLNDGIKALLSPHDDCPILLEVITDSETDMQVYQEYYNFITQQP